MKKLCVSLLLLLALTACSEPAEETAPVPSTSPETAETAGAPESTEEPTLPLYWIDAQNSTAYYQREPLYGEGGYGYGNGGVAAHSFDFAQATEQIVGEPLELETANLNVFADEESLYWIWSGMITDTPMLLRSDLDGSNREALYEFPQGTSVAVWNGGLAGDGESLYFSYCQISDDPSRPDAYALVRLDPEARTLETLTEWTPFSGELMGVWEGKLLITRSTLAEDCPVEPVYDHYRVQNSGELNPWMTTSLCAFNPLTGTEEVLYSCSGWMLDRALVEDALWCEDGEHRLVRRPLGQTEDVVVTQLPQDLQLMGIYTEDVMFYGQEEGKEWLYVYNRADDTLTRSPQRRWIGGEDRAIWVVCEAGPGQYLVWDDASTGMQQLADRDGTLYLIDGYARYAIASRESLLDQSVPMTPVTRPGTP
ncbi:hypothetical protein [Subdoligranulum variabile]|uniref:DUF5050 domain-containing protein n=1 Tax=Subdoligranulum variabile DSM 15176 TaxID=411471 RepID=D1PLM4_9FIRM|nr:hypothetical protein [Subdoligranulum variabile]EFB76322.1 hypothetical protein SUBVAR_05241 [Subdoligranulum variabile DSM 15176]UWP67932.1 hypothetical protein NQ490_13475 [Subdoligranulum variabile]